MNGEVIRETKDANFTVISNAYLHDTNISLSAKGLLTVMLSLPESWEYSQQGLAKITGESTYGIKKIIDELVRARYLEIERMKPTKQSRGRITYKYTIHEVVF